MTTIKNTRPAEMFGDGRQDGANETVQLPLFETEGDDSSLDDTSSEYVEEELWKVGENSRHGEVRRVCNPASLSHANPLVIDNSTHGNHAVEDDQRVDIRNNCDELFLVVFDDACYHDKVMAKKEIPRNANWLSQTFVLLAIGQQKRAVRSGMTVTCGAVCLSLKKFGDSFARMRLWALACCLKLIESSYYDAKDDERVLRQLHKRLRSVVATEEVVK